MSEPYRPRLVDQELRRALRAAGAVVLEGARACGKTTTAGQVAASVAWLDRDSGLRIAGASDPGVLLTGAVPRLIDEWQMVPDVWNAVRGAVDQRGQPGQFVLTGSATPADDVTRHSGAMRFIRLEMRPMSLFESGLSAGGVSLARLWDGALPTPSAETASLEEIAQAACRGGWPGLLRLDLEAAQDLNRAYLRSIASADVITVDGVRRDPSKVGALLTALGRNTATYVSNRRLQTDCAAFGALIDPATIASYVDALRRVWVLAPQYAWGGHPRSSAPARKAAKRHLVDPALAVAAMAATSDDLLADHAAFGQVFETLVFRDLSVYAQAGGFSVQAFQDAKGNEIDAVVVKGADWAGIEVKLVASGPIIEAAAANLKAIANRMTRRPRFLAVVTASGPTYTRADGIVVVSIGQMGP